jgi:hypothetical protein
MIGANWSVAACIQVNISNRIPNRFLRLLELDRMNAPATALKEPWRRLFNDKVLAAAKKRLIQYNRPDLANPYN